MIMSTQTSTQSWHWPRWDIAVSIERSWSRIATSLSRGRWLRSAMTASREITSLDDRLLRDIGLERRSVTSVAERLECERCRALQHIPHS